MGSPRGTHSPPPGARLLLRPGLYRGSVAHRRPLAPTYQFRYGYTTLLVDLDRIDETVAALPALGHNRFAPVALYDRDHGPKDGSPLRPWIDGVLDRAGLPTRADRVLLMATPRVLGHAFNPLSIWFCLDTHGQAVAILAEVRNTFGEWHGYLLHDDGRPMPFPVRSEAAKQFHVSPFFPVEGSYRFRITAPGDHYTAVVQYHGAPDAALMRGADAPAEGGHPKATTLRLSAIHRARWEPLTNAALWQLALRLPPPGIRALAGIHWEALKIWLRGARYHPKPPRPTKEIDS